MKRKVGRILIIIGIVLVVGALALFGYNRWDDWRAGNAVAEAQDKLYAAELEGLAVEPDIPTEMATINIDGWDYIGTLSIPRFGLELPIMSEWSYEGMAIAPGRYSGSVWTHDLVICGHNYTRHFEPLLNAEVGDTVIFTDVLDNVFNYEVSETEILQPTAIEDMIYGDDWDLTLFTCTFGGQTRMTVRCTQVDS